MTTRRSLRSAPLEVQDAENEPVAPFGKQALTTKQKMGKPRAALIDLSNVRTLLLPSNDYSKMCIDFLPKRDHTGGAVFFFGGGDNICYL